MVPDVRSSGSSFGVNLLTTEGVAAALALVRESGLSREEKRELRDLVFAYSVRGGDASLRTTLEGRLHALATVTAPASTSTMTDATPAAATKTSHVAVESRTDATVAVTTSPDVVADAIITKTLDRTVVASSAGFSSGRVVPQFAAPVSVEPATVSASQPIPESLQESVSTSIEQSVIEVQTQDNVKTPAESEAVSTTQEDVVVQESSVAMPDAPVVVLEMPPLATPATESTTDDYRARIAEIKNTINAKVGNPVNLVDMDNEVGRAYMTALLEAMKAVASDNGAAAAMERLEAVVRQVETVLTHRTPATIPEKTPVISNSVPVPTESALAATEPMSPVRINPVVPVMPSVTEAVTVSAPVIPPTPTTAPVAVSTEAPSVESAPVSGFASQGTVAVAPEDTIPVTPIAIASSRFKNIKPMSDVDPLKKPTDLPTAQELKARSGITDPLQDPDVDLGLEQLLGEWSIFRKSGVFGTGPKGRQHPLFVKLAAVQIPLILAGRFEGVTPEIRQSITDYMNGWRYEQGITYEQDELFEHYLRRVIRHILDSQTRRRAA